MAGGIVFVILLPVLLPIAMFQHSRHEKRMRALAEIFRCLNCGLVLGAEALKLADEAWADYVAKLDGRVDGSEPTRDWNTLYRRRIVKGYDAICPHCGTYHSYAGEERTFILSRPADIPLKPGEQPPQMADESPPSAKG